MRKIWVESFQKLYKGFRWKVGFVKKCECLHIFYISVVCQTKIWKNGWNVRPNSLIKHGMWFWNVTLKLHSKRCWNVKRFYIPQTVVRSPHFSKSCEKHKNCSKILIKFPILLLFVVCLETLPDACPWSCLSLYWLCC